jgi:pimeloyl-ACP methyl ester carboxylesterase
MLEVRSPDGTRIGCDVLGDGPALLLVHGSVNDRTRWEPVRGALAGHFRLFAMDRRGRGLSAGETLPYDIDREAEDIRAVVGAIGEPVRVLAHSYGATCTLRALEGGLQAEHVLLYEPPFATDTGPAFPVDVIEDVEAALARGDLDAALVAFLTRVIRLDERTLAAMRRRPEWEVRIANARTVAREGRCVNAYRPGAGLSAAGPSVRILLGTETPPALTASTRAAHAALPGSDLRLLPGHAHSAMDVDPPFFVEQVLDWLR